MSAPPPDNILIVGPSWIGDMVMAQSLCMTLRQQAPEAAIDFYAPGWSLPIVQRMPQVRQAIESPFAHGELNWHGRRLAGKSLASRQYDCAVVLPRSFKSALVPYFAKIPRRIGFRGEMRFGLINEMRHLDKQRLPRTVDRYVALSLEPSAAKQRIPYPSLAIDAGQQQKALQRLGLKADPGTVALMPGAEYGPAKQWPVDHFAALAETLTAHGLQVWIFGSAKEQKTGMQIAQAAGDRAVNLCGRTTLADVVDLLALCKSAVTNDSGLMHVAAATGTRVIALYGSSSPHFTPPLSDNAKIVWLEIECSPCFDRVCRFGHYRCLEEIQVPQVAALID